MSFKSIFQEVSNRALSPLMEGREKVPLTSILNQEVTLVNVDLVSGNNGVYVVFLLEEHPKGFFTGGTVVTDKFTRTSEACDGWDNMVAAIMEEAPKVRFTSKLSKNRRPDGGANYYTDMEVL